MTAYQMVFGIVFVVFAGLVLMKYFDRKKQDAESDLTAEDVARLADLEERVKVLERIVTDKRYDLHREFDDLKSGR